MEAVTIEMISGMSPGTQQLIPSSDDSILWHRPHLQKEIRRKNVTTLYYTFKICYQGNWCVIGQDIINNLVCSWFAKLMRHCVLAFTHNVCAVPLLQAQTLPRIFTGEVGRISCVVHLCPLLPSLEGLISDIPVWTSTRTLCLSTHTSCLFHFYGGLNHTYF